MYNEEGETIWERSLDAFGKVQEGSHKGCPFMYQGQYYDEEVELAYNRFRYYDPKEGRYISKDPIGLNSGEPNFYAYVDDSNRFVDPFGLSKTYIKNKFPDEDLPRDGKIVNHKIVNGRIKEVNGRRHFDFVVTKDNKIVIGNKHHFLGNSQDVLAAGEIRLNGKGQIRHIDNLSGHYRPTISETRNFGKVLSDAGLDVNGATLNTFKISTDSDGFVTGVEKFSSKVL